MKDWTGNKKTTYISLGASNHSKRERAEHDYYATDPTAVDDLFKVENFSHTLWECACGEGHLSNQMEDWGKDVYSTDLVDRGYGKTLDFLNQTLSEWNGDIITNPPYKYAQEFAEKALYYINKSEVGDLKVAMFLKLTFLEGQKRKKFFEKYPPAKVYVYSKRKDCALNGNFQRKDNSAVCYAWFVWYQSYKGDTLIKWI